MYRALNLQFVEAVRSWWDSHSRVKPAVAGAIYWDTELGHTCYRERSDETRLTNLARRIGYSGPIWA